MKTVKFFTETRTAVYTFLSAKVGGEQLAGRLFFLGSIDKKRAAKFKIIQQRIELIALKRKAND